MRYPKPLPKNGTIGFIAPAFGASSEPYETRFKNALKIFQEMGYQVDIGPNCYEKCGIGISNTPEKCGQELTDYYCSPKNQLLLTCGGGELMCEILDFIDFEKIKAAPAKWFMGYSDNTNFTYLSATLCDTAAIYGPCAPTFGTQPWHPSLTDALDLITGDQSTMHGYELWESSEIEDVIDPLAPFQCNMPTVMKTHAWDGTPISGRFLGGCMDCLSNLLGTNFDRTKEFTEKYKEDGIIWFLEAADLNNISIRRALWQMKHAGWFSHVKAFLFGRPYHFGENLFGVDQYTAVTDILGDLNVPIFMDLDIGHLPPSMPIITGGYGTIRPYKENIQVSFEEK